MRLTLTLTPTPTLTPTLFKRFIIKCQRLNALIYTFGAFIFVVGSVFFMPQMEGCQITIKGC